MQFVHLLPELRFVGPIQRVHGGQICGLRVLSLLISRLDLISRAIQQHPVVQRDSDGIHHYHAQGVVIRKPIAIRGTRDAVVCSHALVTARRHIFWVHISPSQEVGENDKASTRSQHIELFLSCKTYLRTPHKYWQSNTRQPHKHDMIVNKEGILSRR